jgi:hypothetical protein
MFRGRKASAVYSPWLGGEKLPECSGSSKAGKERTTDTERERDMERQEETGRDRKRELKRERGRYVRTAGFRNLVTL